MGKLLRVIPETNTIETDNGNLSYDYLVLAMGTETNFFGNENVMNNALAMKTIDEALNIAITSCCVWKKQYVLPLCWIKKN
jgi:NADH dehydrogenase